MTNPTPLLPAAQAVLDAFRSSHTGQACLAAALRAVAEHCVPDDSEGHWIYIPHVLAIAAELDNHQPTGESDYSSHD